MSNIRKIIIWSLATVVISFIFSIFLMYIIYRIPEIVEIASTVTFLPMLEIVIFIMVLPIISLPVLCGMIVFLKMKNYNKINKICIFLISGILELVLCMVLSPIILENTSLVIYRNELSYWGYEIIMGLKFYVDIFVAVVALLVLVIAMVRMKKRL